LIDIPMLHWPCLLHQKQYYHLIAKNVAPVLTP
jgi:hypothetical protein